MGKGTTFCKQTSFLSVELCNVRIHPGTTKGISQKDSVTLYWVLIAVLGEECI